MNIPDNYIGHKEFLDKGIIQEFYPLDNILHCNKWVTEDIINNYGKDYRVHIVRITVDTVNFVRNACIHNGVAFRNHTSVDRLTVEEEKEFFKEPLTQHIVLGVKGFFRRANLIPNAWKLKIGSTHELFTKLVDNNVQIQGLTGRMTGYWKDFVVSGHKTGPHRTSIKAVQEYEATFNDPFGQNSYRTSGFKKQNGSVSANNTMLSPSNINGLIPVNNIGQPSVINQFGITDIFTSSTELMIMLKGMLIGRTVKYGINNGEMRYDRKDISLHVYRDKDSFSKLDIYAGISKKIDANSITCRIIPVFCNNIVNYIGVYNKLAVRSNI